MREGVADVVRRRGGRAAWRARRGGRRALRARRVLRAGRLGLPPVLLLRGRRAHRAGVRRGTTLQRPAVRAALAVLVSRLSPAAAARRRSR